MLRIRMESGEVLKKLEMIVSAKKAEVLSRFFKTGPGEYGEGDVFLGVTMPEIRKVAKEFRELSFSEIEKLLASPYHEARLTGLLVLTYAYGCADGEKKKRIYDFLLDHRAAMNNWDLVDTIAPKIVGGYLLSHRSERKLLRTFSKSENLWERRISIVSTFAFIRDGEFDETLAICKTLLGDRHDLIHKATGWMLREVGKRDEPTLRGFLDTHASLMPRTMLRSAIERLPEGDRKAYLETR